MAEKVKKSPTKIVAIIFTAILIVLLAFMIIFNAVVRISYSLFYENSEFAFDIPGVNNGFVPQDLDYIYEDGSWLFSGYMADGSASPLYRMTADGEVYRLTLAYINGDEYAGHGSAITSNEAFAFLSCDEGMLIYDLEELLQAEDGDTVSARRLVEMDFAPAFMNIQNDILYAGNFYLEGTYDTPEEHHLTTPDGTENHAVLYAYHPTEVSTYGYSDVASQVYSIPEKVQGLCITQDGRLVLSTSYGTDSSHLLVYDFESIEPEGEFTLGNGDKADLYYVDSRRMLDDISAPPMSEGIVWHDDKVYVAEEAASSKYMFGRLYGAGKVYALTLPSAE